MDLRASPLDAARIVADATIFRLKKREMGNLVTSTTLAFALGLPLLDVGHRLVFGAVLNAFVYLVNDLFDVEIDVRAEGRDVARTRFLAEHVASGWLGAVGLLAMAAAIAALHGKGLLVVLAANTVVIVLYSRWLKRHPGVDILAMATWGTTMALVGCPLDHRVGLRLVGLLALLCMVTEGVQVIRDAETDARAGLRTTAVVFGVGLTAATTRVLIVASAAYTTLYLHAFLGPVLLVGLLWPLTPATASRTWDLLRGLFGATWLGLLAYLRVVGHLRPLLP
ncbi:MAG: UbiA family prenyltransferase [Myxococcales bacterium]|nr:UbiA family prenyltransferase [Myxococcales bacterium]